MPDKSFHPIDPRSTVAMWRPMIVIVLITAGAVDSMMVGRLLGPSPAWFRPAFIGAEIVSMTAVVFVLLCIWRIRDAGGHGP